MFCRSSKSFLLDDKLPPSDLAMVSAFFASSTLQVSRSSLLSSSAMTEYFGRNFGSVFLQ